MSVLEQEEKEAVQIARDAGRILMEIYATDFSVQYKGNADPVTTADRRANEQIVTALRKAFPGDGVVAEETADTSDARTKGRCWYVDPLDGTKEFIAKNGEFSVMLGLSIDGRAALGVVYQPVTDRLYRGVVGRGAVLELEGRSDALRVSDKKSTADLRLVVSRSHRSSSTDKLVEVLEIREERASGSVGLKVGLIATREADLYVHVSDRSSAWDACGPDAILHAAGGRFTDLAGDPFIYGGSEMKNARGILACNATAFDAVLPAVAQIGRAAGLIA